MCGIFGLIREQGGAIDPNLIDCILKGLQHRGPDDAGYLLGTIATGNICLGDAERDACEVGLCNERHDLALVHRRLSILDLSAAGRQPMADATGRYWIVFNGEIYNYLELRAELTACGHRFCTGTDTEVILEAYAQWGKKALNRFVGMFAFALLDRQARTLLLVRDFFGIKPLYYTYTRGSFAFASEIKALLQMPGVERQVHPQRLYDYLRFGRTDFGGDTLFQGIRQLPAAHTLEIRLDSPRPPEPMEYWRLEVRPTLGLNFEQAAERMREQFLESVRLHLRSDVPVGCCLSGGIDSSALVMAMRQIGGKDLELHTFTYVANDARVNEEPWSDLVAAAAGAIAHKVRPTPEDLIEDLEHLILTQEEPFGSTSIYAQYRVFRLAHEAGIKVMLDGQGADEMFAGYPNALPFRAFSLLRHDGWGAARRFLRQAACLPGSAEERYAVRLGGLLLPPQIQPFARQLVGKDRAARGMRAAWFAERGTVPHVGQIAHGDQALRAHLQEEFAETSLPMLLRYEDRNSMTYSIESRVPFLTPALADLAFAMPEEYLLAPDATSKAVLRRALRGLVPDAILDRKDKIGFATPEKQWLTALRPWVQSVFDSEYAALLPMLNLDAVRADWNAALSGQRPFDFRIWRWINLVRWAEQFQVTF
jgi:asparagine synthase (glutamine-hydrolysing)